MNEIIFETGKHGPKVSIVGADDSYCVRIDGGPGMTTFGEQTKFDATRSAEFLAIIVYKGSKQQKNSPRKTGSAGSPGAIRNAGRGGKPEATLPSFRG